MLNTFWIVVGMFFLVEGLFFCFNELVKGFWDNLIIDGLFISFETVLLCFFFLLYININIKIYLRSK